MAAPADRFEAWLAALDARHLGDLTRPAYFKALRALSARYVETRRQLTERSPLDSTGKRAAFATFYAPLHLLTTREIVRRLGLGRRRLDRIVDLGCGTGAAGLAWAAECGQVPAITGVDVHPWTLDEARRAWRHFGVAGTPHRGDLVTFAASLAARPGRRAATGVVLGWSVNELPESARGRLLPSLLRLAGQGATVIVIEPISRAAAPWWGAWATAFAAEAGARADEWSFDLALPPPLADVNEAAGFAPRVLSARSLLAGG